MKFVIKSGYTVRLYSGDLKIEALAQFLKENFASWNSNNLTYTDTDGDKITLTTQDDLDALLDMNPSSQYIKLEVTQQPTNQKTQVVEAKTKRSELQKSETVTITTDVKPEPVNTVTESIEALQKKEEKKSRKESKRSKSRSPQKWHDKKWREQKLKQKKKRSPSKKEEKPSTSSEGSERESPNKEKIQKIEGLINQKIAQMVDERIKSLIPCLKNQLSESFEVSVSTHNAELKHQGVFCNGCNINPIIGIRYKCIECPSFNFCSTCEQKIEHEHNFLKMKKAEEKSEKCKSNGFWKAGKHLFREMKHHRGTSSESQHEKHHHRHRHGKGRGRFSKEGDIMEHRINKRLFKLRAVFGQQENFREFIQKYSSLKPKELLEVYALQNNVSQEEFQAKRDQIRKSKLAAFYDCPEEQFDEVVKANPKLNFREIIMKLKETGERTYTGENFKNMRQKLKKFNFEGSDEKKVETRHEKYAFSKSKSKDYKRKRSLMKEKMIAMESLFGEERSGDYKKFIKENPDLNEEETISKWIEKITL